MIDVEAVLYTKLSALASTTPVYLAELPQEVNPPAVVYAVRGQVSSAGTAPLYMVQIEVTCNASTRAAAGSLAATIRAGLQGWIGAATGVRVGPLDGSDELLAYDSELDLWSAGLRWSAPVVRG